MDDTRAEAEARAQAAATRMAEVLLVRLGPVVERYRTRVAQRLHLQAGELACIELLRRSGPVPSNKIGEWTGPTRSAVAKMVLRLERRGHVRRRPRAGRGHDTDVELVADAERDALLDRLHARVVEAMRHAVSVHRLHDPDLRAAAEGTLVQMVACLYDLSTGFVDQDRRERRLRRLQKERAAAAVHPSW